MSLIRTSLLLVPVVLLGCGKKNELETSAATGAIRTAEAVGATDVPEASLHLQLAREQIAAAEKLNEEGDEERAKSMLARAAADAELALLLSREQSQKDEADAAMKRVTELQSNK
jgi:thioredoxin-like negative regulator of GroEL